MAVSNFSMWKKLKIVGKVGWWQIDEVNSVIKTSSTYHIKKFGIEKIMLALVHHLVGHGRLQSKLRLAPIY
jgi:hypothetical protein